MRGPGTGEYFAIKRGNGSRRQMAFAQPGQARDQLPFPFGNVNDRSMAAFHLPDLAGKLSPLLEEMEHLQVDPVHPLPQALHLP